MGLTINLDVSLKFYGLMVKDGDSVNGSSAYDCMDA